MVIVWMLYSYELFMSLTSILHLVCWYLHEGKVRSSKDIDVRIKTSIFCLWPLPAFRLNVEKNETIWVLKSDLLKTEN